METVQVRRKQREYSVNQPLRCVLPNLDKTYPYLGERGLLWETINTFGVGYCAQGASAGWIAIPIHNEEGQLVAYAERWLGIRPRGFGKYRFPRGFRKSLELYNLHRALAENLANPLVLVEGFFDCMKVWQAGFPRVVALMGSVLSQTQEELLLKACSSSGRVILLFDEDAAGRKARVTIRRKLEQHLKVQVVKLDREGLQPDQLCSDQIQCLLR